MTSIDLPATRSHRGGQGFESPQLHRVLAGQVTYSSFWLSGREPLRSQVVDLRFGWGFTLLAADHPYALRRQVMFRVAQTKVCPQGRAGNGWCRVGRSGRVTTNGALRRRRLRGR